MKNLFITFCLLLLRTTYCFCIDLYEPGYIVTLEHDTIQGYIYVKDRDDIRTKIMFKHNENDIPNTYYPEDILGFKLNNGELFRPVTYIHFEMNDIYENERVSEKYFARVLFRCRLQIV